MLDVITVKIILGNCREFPRIFSLFLFQYYPENSGEFSGMLVQINAKEFSGTYQDFLEKFRTDLERRDLHCIVVESPSRFIILMSNQKNQSF